MIYIVVFGFAALVRCHAFSPRFTALHTATASEADGSRVIALVLRPRFPILNFARSNINNKLSELGRITRALLPFDGSGIVGGSGPD